MEITGPTGYISNNQPSVSGSVTSTGGNITGVYGRYGSGRSSWMLATPVDGTFDSPYEEFVYTVLGPLLDGEHIIEIKSLNEVGEKDAVLYAV
ncbi:MAG: hypothetical protein DRI36_03955 [Caldiserica bacterium]|nr:MAG: hypothetical protein DRI36_03955 [Caldisericota bacterium]